MFKALGAAFIFTGAYFIGNYVNGAYKKRLEQLTSFRTLVSELILSIRYRPADVPQLLRDAAQKLSAPFCETLNNIADGLSGSDCVGGIWQRAYDANRKKFSFKDDEFEYIAKNRRRF
jgi:stage III sporulation protein AB